MYAALGAEGAPLARERLCAGGLGRQRWRRAADVAPRFPRSAAFCWSPRQPPARPAPVGSVQKRGTPASSRELSTGGRDAMASPRSNGGGCRGATERCATRARPATSSCEFTRRRLDHLAGLPNARDGGYIGKRVWSRYLGPRHFHRFDFSDSQCPCSKQNDNSGGSTWRATYESSSCALPEWP